MTKPKLTPTYMNNMNVINKYLTEAKITNDKSSLKKLIQNPKTVKFSIGSNDDVIQSTHAGDTLILKYPSNMMELTYNLIQVCDALKLEYQEIGMSDRKNMKFIVDLG